MAKKQPITSDDRFKDVHNDPRFKLPKRNDFKVEVDERFKNSDLASIKKKSKIDKYGRKVDQKADTFDKYFKSKDKYKKKKVESEEEEESESESETGSESESDDESEEEEKVKDDDEDDESSSDDGEEEDPAVSLLDRARGEGLNSDASSGDESSSDESSSDESSEEESESEDEEEDKPEETEPSKRFAVVNLDWDHVKSVDLMATFQSFVPSDGLIENVSIYPSEFGKDRMQREDIEGPPRELFQKKKKKKAKDSDDESDSDSDSELEAKDLYEEGDGTTDFDSKSLRNYQLQRLRYYYAVVTCDTIKTAKNIYDNCDGTEYESTANLFDLRFVPDEMEFDDEPRDSCTKIPSNYKPESFVTDALQQSKVKLTWDETPAERVKMSSKAFSQRELDDMDFKAYLASDNSDDDDQEANESLKNKYKNLVSASTKIGDRDIFDKDDDKEDIDMEITFTPGLDDKSATKVDAEEKEEEESTIDKLKRKAKERRKARKDKLKALKQQEIEEKKAAKAESKSQKSKKPKEQDDAKSKAELELLMLDEDASKEKAQHFNLKELVRSEKEKGKKSKHRNKDKIIEDDFQADLNDPRFKEIFTNHDFAIDPTQPQFKKTSTMNKILEERNKRRDDADEVQEKSQKKEKKRKLEADNNGITDVKSLVQKLKKKSKKN